MNGMKPRVKRTYPSTASALMMQRPCSPGRASTFEDTRFDYGEPRFITIGRLAGYVVVVAHTPRRKNTRIISMRKGNRREEKAYQEQLETP